MKQLLFLLLILFCACALHAQTVVLKKPTGGEVWPAYSTQRIEWTVVDNVDNIKIEISTDSNKTWQTLAVSYPMSASYFDFTVPAKKSDSCFIRISNTLDPSNTSKNIIPFKIPAPALSMGSVNEVLRAGQAFPIQWEATGLNFVRISIAYDSINFVTVKDSADAGTGVFHWKVPAIYTTKARVKVSSYVGNIEFVPEGCFSVSPAFPYSIVKYKGGSFDGHSARSNLASLLQIQNTGLADSVNANATLNVQWTFQNTERIHILYSLDSMQHWTKVLSDYPAAAANANMNVPDTAARMFIKLQNADDTTIASVSKKLVIRDKYLSLQVVNKDLYTNVPTELRWVGIGISQVKLHYQLVNKTPVLIKNNLSGTQEVYIWTAQNLNDSIRFIITDITNAALTDTSAWYRIGALPTAVAGKYKGGAYDGHSSAANRKGIIKVTQPENAKWNGSFNNMIEWQSNNIERVQIAYSLDSGATFTVIANDYPASAGKYEWKTPSIPTTKGFIRLRDVNDTTVSDRNDTAFTILNRSISLNKEVYTVYKTQPYQIAWKQSGIDSVTLFYKQGANGNKQTIKTSVSALQEVYNWIIPAAVSDSLYIGVRDVTDASVADSFLLSKKVDAAPNWMPTKYHGGSFDGHSMRSSKNIILISKPAPNEIISSGTQYKITWSTINISDSIVIQFSVDSGATWTTITSQLATNGEYTWIVPNKLNVRKGFTFKLNGNGNLSSNLCLMRALDPVTKEVVGVTPKPFTILVPNTKFLNLVKFTLIPDLKENIQTIGLLAANATAKTKVNFFIKSGSGVLIGDSLKALKQEVITVGAYAAGDSIYAATDTVYRDICVQPIAPVISITGNKNLCAADSILIQAQKTFDKYKWTTGDTTAVVNIKQTAVVKLQIWANGCWSGYSDSVKIYKDTTAQPVITLTGDSVICADKNAVLSSSPATAYQWFNKGTAISNAQSKNYTVTGSGVYTVRIVTNIGCMLLSESKQITVNALPVMNGIQGPPMIALNDTATYYHATAGGTWSVADATVFTVTNTGFVKGWKDGKSVLYYQVTNNTGCTAKDSLQITVSAAAAGVSISGKDQLCQNDNATYQSSVNGGSWSVSNTTVLQMNNGTVKALKPGTATVMYTVNVSGITVVKSVVVTVKPLPVPPKIMVTGDSVFCEGGSVLLSTTSSDKIKWYRNAVMLPNDSLNTLKVTQSGSYQYQATAINSCAAFSASQSVVVNANPIVSKITGKNTVVINDTTMLHNNTAGGVWSSSKPNTASVNAGGVVTGISEGTVVIRYTVTNNVGCSAADSVNMLVKPLITLTGPGSVCLNNTKAALSANIAGGVWSSSDLSIASVTTNGVLKPVKPGKVQLAYTVISSGTPVSAFAEVTVLPIPSKPIISVNGNVLTASGNEAGYAWFINGVKDSAASKIITAKISGGYTVQVTNTEGCSVTSELYPILISDKDALQFAPNPSKGQFRLQYIMDEPGLMQITIRSAAGKEVYKKLIQQAAGIYTENVNLNVIPGLYYIEMHLTNKTYRSSIMIMR